MISITKIDDSNLQKKIRNAMETVASDAETDAFVRCPIKTGVLINSIKKDKKSNKEWEVGTHGVAYADAVEYGTNDMIRAHGEHDPEEPVVTWKALRDRGEVGLGNTLPYLRPFAYDTSGLVKSFKGGFK